MSSTASLYGVQAASVGKSIAIDHLNGLPLVVVSDPAIALKNPLLSLIQASVGIAMGVAVIFHLAYAWSSLN